MSIETLRRAPGKWRTRIGNVRIPGLILRQLGLTAGQQAAAVRELDRLLLARADADGVARVSNSVHIGIGTRPA